MDAPCSPRVRPTGTPRGRLPLRRSDGRGRHRAPLRDEPDRRGAVAAVVLVRACAPSPGAEGMGGEAGERGGRAARPPPPGKAQQRGQDRKLLAGHGGRDRKSTRLNSSHVAISYAVFCLKKKKQ